MDRKDAAARGVVIGVLGLVIGFAIGHWSAEPVTKPPTAATTADSPVARAADARPAERIGVRELRGNLSEVGIIWPGSKDVDPQRVNWPKPVARGWTADERVQVIVSMRDQVEKVELFWDKPPADRHIFINAISLGLDPSAREQILDRVHGLLNHPRGEAEEQFQTARLTVAVRKDEESTCITFTPR